MYRAPEGRPCSSPPGMDSYVESAPQVAAPKKRVLTAGEKAKRAAGENRREQAARRLGTRKNRTESDGVWLTGRQVCARFGLKYGNVTVIAHKHQWQRDMESPHRLYLVPHDWIAGRVARVAADLPNSEPAPVELPSIVAPPPRSIWARLFGWMVGR